MFQSLKILVSVLFVATGVVGCKSSPAEDVDLPQASSNDLPRSPWKQKGNDLPDPPEESDDPTDLSSDDGGGGPPPTCTFSATKANQYCTDRFNDPAAVAAPQATCEHLLGGVQVCDYQPGPLAETCARTNFAADWPGAPVITNGREFCTYLGTDAFGGASDLNCDSVFLVESNDPIGAPESVCSRIGAALGGGQCEFVGIGPLASWNDPNYCDDIIDPANRGALTVQQACESSGFQIINPLPHGGPPNPTNTNRDGLRFCTYTAAQACVPRGDPCTGKDKAACMGALAPLCDWGP